jgi:hypothetical protein
MGWINKAGRSVDSPVWERIEGGKGISRSLAVELLGAGIGEE